MPAELSRASVLIVDDHPANLIALEAVLEPLGQKLVRATSGEQALKLLLTQDFACILLDVQMPGMDGFETAKLIKQRERSRHIPILFLTAINNEEKHVVRGYAEGAVDYLMKPYDPDLLRAKVHVFVHLWLREEKLREQERAVNARERELLRERNEQTEERLSFALKAGGLGYWKLNLATRALELSEGCKANFGLPPGAELSTCDGLNALIHPDDRAQAAGDLEAAIRGGADYVSEYRVQNPDGEVRWVSARGRVTYDARSTPSGLVGITVDVTERRRTEEERESLLRALEGAVRTRDEFLSIASHELKTPLTPLTLKLQNLTRAFAEAPDANTAELSRRDAQMVTRQVKRLSDLVDDLLDVSRLTLGRLTLKPEDVDLGEVAAEVAKRFEAQAERAECALNVHAPRPVRGRWDRLRLEQVVSNLLGNALKYGPGKPITVEVNATSRMAQLQVKDEGIGIAATALGRIFEKFERGVSDRNYGGLGLGLYVTRQIVQAMGGSVSAHSTPGQGATFEVLLPLERPPTSSG